MNYYIDGYNLIFCSSLIDSGSLEKAREEVIALLSELEIPLTVVFDGKGVDHPERGHRNLLEVVYTSAGQSADDYIIEEIFRQKKPRQQVVVTSDKQLARICREAGASIQTVEIFLFKLKRRKSVSSRDEKPFRDSKSNIERLLKIFTSRS